VQDELTWQLEDGRWTLRIEDDCEYVDEADVGGEFTAVISDKPDEGGLIEVEIEHEMRASPVYFWYRSLDEAKEKGREELKHFVDNWRRQVKENNRRYRLQIDW
jgi:hypothetical protein